MKYLCKDIVTFPFIIFQLGKADKGSISRQGGDMEDKDKKIQVEYFYSDKPMMSYSAMIRISEIEKGGEYITPSPKMNTRSIKWDW